MHVKSEFLKSFFDAKGEGNCCSKKTEESDGKENWVQEEGDQENKKVKQKTEWKRRWMRNVMNKNKMWWKKDERKT